METHRTTTTTKRSPLLAVCLFRSGMRDGIDCPHDLPSITERSHRLGCVLGHTVARVSARRAA